MRWMDATEEAYKNGFAAGVKAAERHTHFVGGECQACGWFGDCCDTPYYKYCPDCGAKVQEVSDG